MDSPTPRVRLLDLQRQLDPIREELREAAEHTIASGWYLLGDRTSSFETEFATYVGQPHGVACANGTDAITLALMALGTEPGDEVITVSNTAFASACGISRAGANPVFADVDPDTWMIDASSVREKVTERTRAVLAVHLYGQVVDLGALREALPSGVEIIEDCAQAHAATEDGAKVGSLEKLSCFSFYPSKNLGALGDAGMVLCDSDELAARLRASSFYGRTQPDQHDSIGMNSRMDEVQAAFLSAQLPHLDAWIARRREIAAIYDRELADGIFARPRFRAGTRPAYHLYVVRVQDREGFRNHLDVRGIDTGIHYPTPIHRQPAYGATDEISLSETESLCREIVSLPVAPHLSDEEVARVVEACASYAGSVR